MVSMDEGGTALDNIHSFEGFPSHWPSRLSLSLTGLVHEEKAHERKSAHHLDVPVNVVTQGLMPYIQGVSEFVTRILAKIDVKVYMQPKMSYRVSRLKALQGPG